MGLEIGRRQTPRNPVQRDLHQTGAVRGERAARFGAPLAHALAPEFKFCSRP